MFIADNPALATDLFFASTSLDAQAFLELNHARFKNIFFFITGHIPEKYHAEFIQPYLPGRKLHFIFSKDDTGALCDLKLASYIRNKPLKISYQESHYNIHFENRNYQFDRLSLNALEKASGYNFRIRTHKPKKANTYHEQLYRRHPA